MESKYICEECGNEFFPLKRNVQYSKLKGLNRIRFCSKQCSGRNSKKEILLECANCGKQVYKKRKERKKRVKVEIFFVVRAVQHLLITEISLLEQEEVS